MATIQAFSSISVTDRTDAGTLNFYLTSNQPSSVVYNPNQNAYTPNWATSNLQITPVISYNGTSLNITDSNLTINYLRREGSGPTSSLLSGEVVSNGVLTVSANKLSDGVGGVNQLTYICNVTYTSPDVGISINGQASLTYTLLSGVSGPKTVNITGDNTFLYDGTGAIQSPSTITLRANFQYCTGNEGQWEYKNSNGDFVAYPSTADNASINGNTLVVRNDLQSIWNNNTALIRRTIDSTGTIYDTFQIVKIYDGTDGADGSSTISVVLSNDSFIVACDKQGTPKTGAFDGSSTTITIFNGNQDVTSQWTVNASAIGVSGTYSNYTYTPNSLTQDYGYVTFTCSNSSYPNIIKKYGISKQYSGADGKDAVVYELVPSVYSMNINSNNEFTPQSVTFSAYKKEGSTAKTAYSGTFVIDISENGTTFTSNVQTENSVTESTYTPSSTTKIIRCSLYDSATQTLLDQQSTVIAKDGRDGTDGITMGLGNYSDLIPCNENGLTVGVTNITIPFFAYKGITKIPVTATIISTLPSGIVLSSNVAGTNQNDGVITLTVANNSALSGTNSGVISIQLAADGKSNSYNYTWTKSLQGGSAIVLQLYSMNGGKVKDGIDTTINAIIRSNTTDLTSNATFVWKKFVSGEYTVIQGETNSSITINSSSVNDQMWLECDATYGGTVYKAYYTVDDVSDPISSVTYATIREFKNGEGFGAIYTRVYRNGVEIDPIKSLVFSDTAPTSASNGDFYYHLDTTNKTCALKRYNGSIWSNPLETDADVYVYTYYTIDKNGNIGSTTLSGRCQYVDASMINGRMQFICEVNERNN